MITIEKSSAEIFGKIGSAKNIKELLAYISNNNYLAIISSVYS